MSKLRYLSVLLMTTVVLLAQCLTLNATEILEPRYSEAIVSWEGFEDFVPANTSMVFTADRFNLPIVDDDVSKLVDEQSSLLNKGDSIRLTFDIQDGGFYTLDFLAATPASSLNSPEGEIKIDDAYLYYEMRRLIFPNTYSETSTVFPLDRYGNQTYIQLKNIPMWQTFQMRDANFSQPEPLKIYLAKGSHDLRFTLTRESLYLAKIILKSMEPLPSYAQYRTMHAGQSVSGFSRTIEAENPTYRNDTSIQTTSDRGLTVSPYDTYKLLMNTLGGDTWGKSGTTATYEIDVPKAGYYRLSFHAKQSMKSNFTVFRKIYVNGLIPFSEANAFGFRYSQSWKDVVFGAEEAYEIYLNQGKNTIGLEATNSPYNAAIEKIEKTLDEINVVSLEIKKLVGNEKDPFKEWVITDYIPDLKEHLIAIADDLEEDLALIQDVNDSRGSQEALSYAMAIENLRTLAKDPDEIPNRMNRFSEGSGSAAQLLGTVLPLLQKQPLALDTISIYSPDQQVKTKTGTWIDSIVENVKRFIHSFLPDPYNSIGAEEDEIEVWVNRPRQYVDLLQTMADNGFTKETGIKVKFSIMPNESKLVLANAANIQPDVALGVSTNVPYELAIRGALYDLRSFPDFDKFIHVYSPGSLLGYIINESVYAIPETQDFWVTFYRKDIMDSLGIPVPDTWDEVLGILPELQRYGMNFNTPLSSGSGLKGLLMTTPYLFNYGADLYRPDGFSTDIGSEKGIAAIKFMAESFTMYGMPLTTASFYNSFRYGELPIGVSNFETYIKLMTAAPEIAGQWDISLYPAVVDEEGNESRYATGSAQTSIMFKKTDQPDESWRFMKWWMSTQTQTDFQNNLILRYGPEYLWSSANLEAFANSTIPDEHKAIILQQWTWLKEPSKLPGSYMLEREISNVWNKIVFDGANPRVAIDRSIITINREIARKMEEFGYLKEGVVVKPYKVPTLEMIKEWMRNAE